MFDNKIKREISITPDFNELARCFACLDADDMAQFFHAVHIEVLKWKQGGSALSFQLSAVESSSYMTPEGREVMGVIGEYSKPYKGD